ncbi:MAG: kinase to dihydroxyacetone kinase, partial [Clostridium sp.]|nr:kinase to dihydroxyacetone kinase [Clostridium sp.]
LLKVHFHTNEPWQILAYCASLGDVYDIVVENMLRQANGMHG